MKYVVILVVIVILVRIDVVFKLFEKTAGKYQNSREEIKTGDIEPSSDLVSVDNDLSLKTSPHKTFISMLNDFKNTSDLNVKNKAIEVLRSQTTMFSDKLDIELESSIYLWRDLLIQKNKTAHEFLIEMMKYIKGENLEMVRRFYSLAIDIDLIDFFNSYSKSTDTNCIIMGYVADNLSDEEKYNELEERMIAFDAFLLTEKAVPFLVFAKRCQIVLNLEINKLKAVVPPSETAENEPNAEEAATPPVVAVPVAVPDVAPVSAPVPNPVPAPTPGNAP
jgi:hypothetical protein